MMKDVSDEEKEKTKGKEIAGKDAKTKAKESAGKDAERDKEERDNDKDSKDKSEDEDGSVGDLGINKRRRWFDAARVRGNIQRTASLALQKKREEATDVTNMLETSVAWAGTSAVSAHVDVS